MSILFSLPLKESLAYLLSSKNQPQGDTPSWFVKEFQRVEELSRKYVDVVPCDEYCVTVKCCDSVESVYLNASYISDIFPGDDRIYIATQAPIKSCTKEFWHMVLQEETNIIVMVTRLVERGMTQSKCDVYWPTKEQEVWSLGCIQLFLEDEVVVAEKSVILRHIRLYHKLSDGQVEDRLVYQFQYNGWPDHGIPTEKSSFTFLLEQVEKHRLGKSLVVHCSAGIGRTGVFCTLDILRRYLSSHSFLQRLKALVDKGADKEEIADFLVNLVSETVVQIRKRRPGMIQTAEQFRMESSPLQVQERPMRKPIVWSNIGVGAALQLFEVTTLGQPFEVIKTQLAANRKDSMISALKTIYSRGGLSGFYQGLIPWAWIEASTKGGVLFLAQNEASSFIASLGFSQTISDTAGGVFGVEVTRDKTGAGKDLSTLQVAKEVFRTKGISGVYRGVTAVAVRQATNWGSRFGLARITETLFKGKDKDRKLSKWEELGASVVGGALACWNQPIEVIRIEMQSQLKAADRPEKMNIFTCAKYIYKKNGILGFYRGVTPRIGLGVYLTCVMVFGGDQVKELIRARKETKLDKQ
ncbi:Citrate/oxoglutarate carrier protein [Galdieria sulphuraria]|nr:Citrate/oxoglutarate carrier protein [Galdieria sulphuraria]